MPRKNTVRETALDDEWAPSVEDAGYERQPPARTYAYRLNQSLQAADGQTLGYPWVGIVENWHENAFTSFGDGHGVWESTGGATLPFYARNFRDVRQWATKLSTSELVPRIVELEAINFRALPSSTGRRVR